MKLTKEQIDYVRSEIESVAFGRVVIEINAESGKIDVITEKRIRISGRKRAAGMAPEEVGREE